MRTGFRWLMLGTLFILVPRPASCQTPTGTMAFTVSMEKPEAHIFHVVLRCEGLAGAIQDFRMPAWSPGYYGIREFARNVQDFHAADGRGRELKWEHSENSWRVRTEGVPVVNVTYDVRATSKFVADPYLGEDHGYIVGSGVFLYAAGRIGHPVTVEIVLNPAWTSIATGLDAVSPDRPHTFAAPDFDVLYDSPILMGNLESLPPFEIQGVPHYFVGLRLGDGFHRERFMNNLKAVVGQGIAVFGDIPYKHYSFLGIGTGQGGIEHLNSTTVPFSGGPNLDTRAGTIREMNFLGHEYFHNYNVKRIRPIALGPFDYDKPNLTHMLWVSEGFTSYYEYLLVARAGIMNLVELLDFLRRDISAYENSTGRLYQSATQSSWETWSQGPFGGRGRGGISKSISYYNKGAALGMLLDFKIRHETRNGSSLDTVMRALYTKYYKELKRGWTDEEFRTVCETIAGVSLQELFDYASTTTDIDYDRYLGYAGLELEKPTELPDSYLGAIVEDVKGVPVITAVEDNSPARRSGMTVDDVIVTLDGARIDAAGLSRAIASKKPGDRVVLGLTRAGRSLEVTVTLGNKVQRSFKIRPIANPDALQADILADWIKAR